MPYKDRDKYLEYQRAYHKARHKELVASLPEDVTTRGTKRKRKRPEHVMSSVDVESRSGVCSKCGVVPLHRQGTQWKCKNANASAQRKSNLKTKYGLTEKEYEQLLTNCSGRCEACGKNFETEGLWPCVDHDHATGRVRGVLCVNCNTGIGSLGDGIAGVRLALEYLESRMS